MGILWHVVQEPYKNNPQDNHHIYHSLGAHTDHWDNNMPTGVYSLQVRDDPNNMLLDTMYHDYNNDSQDRWFVIHHRYIPIQRGIWYMYSHQVHHNNSDHKYNHLVVNYHCVIQHLYHIRKDPMNQVDNMYWIHIDGGLYHRYKNNHLHIMYSDREQLMNNNELDSYMMY